MVGDHVQPITVTRPGRTAVKRTLAIGLALAALSCRSAEPSKSVAQTLPRTPAVAASFGAADIDRALGAEWQKRGLAAAPRVDDHGFLRRAFLDVVGRIPTLDEIAKFESDRSVARRANLVTALVATPGYADHWTNYWEDVLLLDKTKAKLVDRDQFRRFLHSAFERNEPWNQLVYELVSATGWNRPATPAPLEPPTTSAMAIDTGGPRPTAPVVDAMHPVNGAVNWLLQYRSNPEDLAGKVASTFLGVKIQCAQCHDHKTEKWKQTDFQRFAACFVNMKASPESEGKLAPVELFERRSPAPRFEKRPETASIAAATPAALDGTDFSSEDDRRAALAGWTTSPQNPWFAKAFVNRVWGQFLGRGFVEPVDDFRDSNPGEMPELLDALSKDFVAHGYDVKRLVATIVSTDAYQLSSGALGASVQAGSTTSPLWSRYPLKPLAPDELLDSIAVATDLDDILSGQRGEDLERAKAQLRKQFDFLFDVDEESHPSSYEGTIPQALMLMNGRSVNQTTRVGRQGALLKILGTPVGDGERIDALYRRTLSRTPSSDERDAALAVIPERGRYRQAAFEDLLWALLNSSEFVFNH